MKITKTSKANRLLRLFAWTKIPLIAFCNPKVIALTHEQAIIRLPLNWITRNHFKSMYFGALAIGADLAGGLHAFMFAQENNWKISLAFKDFSASFLSRPTSAVYFVCDAGQQVAALLEKAQITGERQTMAIKVAAYIDYHKQPELVAAFELGLSVKIQP